MGVVIYLLLASKKPAPATGSAAGTNSTAVRRLAAPAAPVVLAEVVEVTDIDPLLDPPPQPETGVPFDAEPTTCRSQPRRDGTAYSRRPMDRTGSDARAAVDCYFDF